MNLDNATIAVTGATGFLGSHLAIGLTQAGARVRAVVRRPERGEWLTDGYGIEVVHGDLTDPASLVRAFDGVDAVVSNAALAGRGKHYDSYYEANVHGTANVVNAVAEAGVSRMVQISTVGVYRTRLLGPNDEDTPMLSGNERALSSLFTDWRYANTKSLAEQKAWSLCKQLGIQLTTLRPGPIYGERDDKLTTRYARAMQRKVVWAPTLRLPHVHAGDVARVLCAALQRPESMGRAYNVVGDCASPFEVARTWRRLAGQGPWVLPIPTPWTARFDDGRARRELGFVPRSLEEGLAGCVEEHHSFAALPEGTAVR